MTTLYAIGQKVNTNQGVKTIREISYFYGKEKGASIYDNFFMKEDCINTRSDRYTAMYSYKEISVINE
jgi:hypothetical protein